MAALSLQANMDGFDLYKLAGVKKVDLLDHEKTEHAADAQCDAEDAVAPASTSKGLIILDLIPADENKVRVRMTCSSPAA
jgi:hypothetical protein